jgi:hypothetical protein
MMRGHPGPSMLLDGKTIRTAFDRQQTPVHVAIDGKTSRDSYTDAKKSNALHFISAWASKHGVKSKKTVIEKRDRGEKRYYLRPPLRDDVA